MLKPWKDIDRFDLKSAVLTLCEDPASGPLVVVADDEGEPEVAADIAEHMLGDYGYVVARIREAGTRAMSVAQLLGSVWRRVDPGVQMPGIPRSVGEARFMEPDALIEEIASCCVAGGVPRAFVFDTVDRDDRLSRSAMSQFAQLAQRTGAPVVVLSRKESGSGLPRRSTVLKMGDMPLWEVKNSLRSAPALADVDPVRLDALVSSIEALADDQAVSAYDAYSVVEEALREIAP